MQTPSPVTRTTVFVGSNFHNHIPLLNYKTHASRADYLRLKNDITLPRDNEFPKHVTLGFRAIFWSVFSELFELDHPSHELRWLDADWTVNSIWILESSDVEASVSLEDSRNIFIFFELTSIDGLDTAYINRQMYEKNLNEQSIVLSLIAAAAEHGPDPSILLSLEHNRGFPSRFVYSTQNEIDLHASIISILAFYSYCLLSIWQINRYQTMIQLNFDSRRLTDLREILRIRAQIINVERLFMTKNFSNNPLLQTHAKEIRKRFDLREKLNPHMGLNESIEKYIATATQLAIERRGQRTNFLLFIFTLLAVPIALIQTILAYDIKPPFVHDGVWKSLEDPTFEAFIINSAGLYIVIILFTLFFIGAGFWSASQIEKIVIKIRAKRSSILSNQKKRTD